VTVTVAARVCVVGCGAIGSVFAAHLALVEGLEVHVYDVSEEHVKAISEKGLRLSGAADILANVNATRRPRDIPPCDFGIFATKGIHTRSAIEQTAHVFGDESAVCSVQNGLGNEEILAEHVSQVIRGATTIAAHMVAPGHAELEFYSDIWIGPFEPSGTARAHVEGFAALLKRAGLPCVPLEDARGAQWTKVIFNSAVNPVGGLTGLHHGAAVRFPPTGALCEALLQEGESVARALGITLHGDPRQMLAEGASAPTKRNPSMLMDVLATRQTEVDFVNGAIADQGERLGVPVPVNRAVWQLMKGLEHSWTDPS
jgi:2-dehydropantoate 2-reductase